MRLVCLLALSASLAAAGTPWNRHTIDDSSEGADGVRMADVNGDGLLDITTGWEEGGRVRVYLNPGPEKAKERWPAVTVVQVASPEDAAFADLDGDGRWDVISSTEGRNQTVYIHWAPADPAAYLDESAWTTQALPASRGLTRWMFALPADIDGKHGVDFFAGSKDPNGVIGWWQAPEDPRRVEDWVWHPLYTAGWIMSLIPRDMDGDGDEDLVATDRYGPRHGIVWLENPGARKAADKWPEHRIGPVAQEEVLFMRVADLNGDGREDVITTVRTGPLVIYTAGKKGDWRREEVPRPDYVGNGKAVAAGDLDLDGDMDLALTYGKAFDGKLGAIWLEQDGGGWREHDVAGPEGIKFDRIELVDLDDDGDLDLITCEERDNLGVIWYENPAR